MRAVPEQYRRKLTKDEINELPLRGYDGPVEVVASPEEMPPVLERLRAASLLGFDTETRPSFRKGVFFPPSLVQLATAEAVFIIQLAKAPLADGLLDLLADPDIIKTGVSVRDDVKELKAVTPFAEAGFVDLGDVARDCGMQTFGLRNLAANVLGFRISKAMQCSNWAKGKLTKKQLRYAATDAWISREIHLRLMELGAL